MPKPLLSKLVAQAAIGFFLCTIRMHHRAADKR